MTRAIDVVRQVAPHAKTNYLSAFENGDALLQQHGINTPDRLAHFLAQVLHESGGLTLEHESLNYRAARLVEIFGVGRHSALITADEAESLAHDERKIAERVYGLGNLRKARELATRRPMMALDTVVAALCRQPAAPIFAGWGSYVALISSRIRIGSFPPSTLSSRHWPNGRKRASMSMLTTTISLRSPGRSTAGVRNPRRSRTACKIAPYGLQRCGG